MALDKWQQRQVSQHADENGLSQAEAERELFPEESPTTARKATAKKEPAPTA